ncbi:Protoheme IX farnesyltransferase [Rhodovastum atsumiense]|uniref:Protoheme IX farnesyltransferase n=1 Tax=Rhodovastum atsumiense TaxID=504468 RepID=A0A5M6IY20_9PROT|nr:heme o synthase [Rhodovastum atsumiense]KAA5613212.1 protoheme IX farnesyltransferase [Rhodovastum atsumiense]CAH2600635.1 Protoheme IX farnesyltransferase [Rhodovastum atsumiense]
MTHPATGAERAADSLSAFPLPGPDLAVSTVADWVTLLKPRVILLVLFTGVVGLLVAPATLHPVLAFTAMLCIAVGAGAAGAINMWYDRDIDAVMRRTARRPIPAGRIEPGEALGFGVTLAAASVILMGLAVNLAAAAGLAFSIGFYVLVYTMWLKRRTPQNIVIGGAAGAFPPAIGWLAATGGLDVMPLLLFAIVFFWTPPHFWALSLWAHGDYARAGVPMLPVVAGARETRRQILLYTVLLVLLSLAPWALGLSGWIYGVTALLLGARFLERAWRVLRDRQDARGVSLSGDAPARAAFRFSILYLFALFGALAVDHFLV